MGKIRNFLGAIFHYETIKIVDIKNKKIGVVYRIIQLLILAYIVGYVVVWKKGYQEEDIAVSAVTTKLKGSTFVDFGNFSRYLRGIQIYDPSDYVVPPQEPNTFFVMTDMVITPDQKQDRCPETAELRRHWCRTDADCWPPMKMVQHGNGVRTGKCVQSVEKRTVKVCEIHGWCPTEMAERPMLPGHPHNRTRPLLEDTKHFTVLLRNEILFPKFNVQLRNIRGYKSRRAFRHCRYDPMSAPACPIFRLGDIVAYCGDNYTEVGRTGAIYGIHVDWNCDLDSDPDLCIPKYHFTRLDDPDSPISHGYNFRYSQYHVIDGERHRTLTKAFGIRFSVLVNARAGRFLLVPLLVKFGAGVALMVVANIWCDLMLLYCLKRRRKYHANKYETLDDEDDDSDAEGGSSTDYSAADVAKEEKETLLPKKK